MLLFCIRVVAREITLGSSVGHDARVVESNCHDRLVSKIQHSLGSSSLVSPRTS